MFKAGYHSRVHKHGDDLSLMLTSKGYDILIDPGKYGYTIGEPHVDYLHSALAHNTVVVDEKSYSISDERTHLAGILEYNLNVKENEYLYVRAFNNSYYGVYIDRAIYHKDEIIFVHDEILSKDNHVYSQMFHLSEYVKVLKESKDEIVGQIGDSGYIIRITQLSGVDDAHIYQGMQPDAKYGYRSPVMKEIVNCTTVRFEKYGSKTEFVTMIAIEPLENISKNIEFFKNKNKIYNCNHISNITLIRRPRPDLSLITCRVDNKIDSIILEADLLEDMSQYVWEVVDVRKNLILESQTTINANCKFFASFCTDICIKVTFITNTNQKLKGIVAYLKYNHRSGYEVVKETEKPLNLQMNGMQMEWLTKETLRCTVLFDYAFDCGLNWHIYRNGGHYFYKYEKNNPTFEYQFTEPGAYTVMFYICGFAGEKEFWNFPQFNIIGKGEICGEQKL